MLLNKWAFFIIITITFVVLQITGVSATSEVLTVDSCIQGDPPGTPCTGTELTNLNTDDTNLGITVVKGKHGISVIADSASTTGDTINSVSVRIRRSGESGINGNLVTALQSGDGLTTYCTNTTPNVVNPETVELLYVTSDCSWTPTRVDDLRVDMLNDDSGSGQSVFNPFLEVLVDYSSPASDPNGTLRMVLNNPVSIDVDQNLSFNINASVFCDGITDADCYEVNFTTFYNFSESIVPTVIMNETLGQVPFYNISEGQFFVNQTCGYMSQGDECSYNLTINATGFTTDPLKILTFNMSINATTNDTTHVGGNDSTFVVNIDNNLIDIPDENGTINVTLNVSGAYRVVQNNTFSINATIRCIGDGDCYEVNVTAYYNFSATITKTVNTTLQGLPISNYSAITAGFVNISCGHMDLNDECFYNLTINATAYPDTPFQVMEFNITVNATTNDTLHVLPNGSEPFTLRIDPDFPIPISSCQTLSTNGTPEEQIRYKLINEISSTGDCLTINANYTVVDCRNFEVATSGADNRAIISENKNAHGIRLISCNMECTGSTDSGCLRIINATGINISDGYANTSADSDAIAARIFNSHDINITGTHFLSRGSSGTNMRGLFLQHGGNVNIDGINSSVRVGGSNSNRFGMHLQINPSAINVSADQRVIKNSYIVHESGTNSDNAALVLGADGFTLINVTIQSAASGIRSVATSHNVNFTNSSITATSTDFWVVNAQASPIPITYFNNISYDKTDLQFDGEQYLIASQFITVEVIDSSDSSSISGAEVNISSVNNITSNGVFNLSTGTTNDDGFTRAITVKEFNASNFNNTYPYVHFSNYTIDVSADGYASVNDVQLDVTFDSRNVTILMSTSDTCTYGGSGTWAIDCADHCIITDDVDLEDNDIEITGVGTLQFDGAIYNWKDLTIRGQDKDNICAVRVNGQFG